MPWLTLNFLNNVVYQFQSYWDKEENLSCENMQSVYHIKNDPCVSRIHLNICCHRIWWWSRVTGFCPFPQFTEDTQRHYIGKSLSLTVSPSTKLCEDYLGRLFSVNMDYPTIDFSSQSSSLLPIRQGHRSFQQGIYFSSD